MSGSLDKADVRSKPLVVQCFEMASVASPEQLNVAAERSLSTIAAGNDLVVVVSAGRQAVDALLAPARTLHWGNGDPDGNREHDQLLASGDQQAIAVMAMSLAERGVPAKALTGDESGLVCEGDYGQAVICQIDPTVVYTSLTSGLVPVLAGGHGYSRAGDAVRLGQGGPQMLAVALANSLGAVRCELIFAQQPSAISHDRLPPDTTFGPTDVLIELTGLSVWRNDPSLSSPLVKVLVAGGNGHDSTRDVMLRVAEETGVTQPGIAAPDSFSVFVPIESAPTYVRRLVSEIGLAGNKPAAFTNS